MKTTGRNLKRRLYGITLIGNRLSRLKHFRGHGVHSPYVYGLVRKVLMHKTLDPNTEHPLFVKLVCKGVAKRRAIELQNLAYYNHETTFSIDDIECTSHINIITNAVDIELLATAAEMAKSNGTTLVILSPYQSRKRRECCSEILWQHNSTSVDNRGYIILFNNHLPKQHYKL